MQSPVPVPFLHTQNQPARRDDVRREYPTTEKSRFAERLHDRGKTTPAEEPTAATETPGPAPIPPSTETAPDVNSDLSHSDVETSLLMVPDDGSATDPLLTALAALLGLDQTAPALPLLPTGEETAKPSGIDGVIQDLSTLLPAALGGEVDPQHPALLLPDAEPTVATILANPAQDAPIATSQPGLPAPAQLASLPAPIKPTAETRQSGNTEAPGSGVAPTLGAGEIQMVATTAEAQTNDDQPPAQPQVPDTLSRREQSAAGGKTIDIQALAPASTSEAAPPHVEAASVERVRRPEAPMANPMDKVVAQQVTRALLREGPEGQRTLSLRLTPPELGTIRVEIIERGGVLQARLHAEDDAVRHALERQLTHMRQDLRANDAPVRDVHLGDAWSGDLARRERDGAQNRSRHQGRDGGFSLEPVAGTGTATLPSPDIIADERVDARA